MTHAEARERMNAAVQRLIASGWSLRQCERLLDGLQREDAVEMAERYSPPPDLLLAD